LGGKIEFYPNIDFGIIKPKMMMTEENLDAQTVISDITDITSNSDGDEAFYKNKLAINVSFETELNKLNHDYLKEKCRQNGISISKLKKPELILALVSGFDALWGVLKEKKMDELRAICKDLNLKGIAGVKKEGLILMIMTQNASCKSAAFVYQPESPLSNIVEKRRVNEDVDKQRAEEAARQEALRIEELEKQRLEAERLEAERLETERAKEEFEKQRIEAERVEAERVEALRQEEAKQSKPVDGEKRKKQSIPKSVKTHVWDLYIGSHINEHRCICCKKTLIKVTYFDVGHVIAEKNGGTLEISNLRPICSVCNYSMGTENMVDFVKKYGYYIG
jgi:5-methylcytosine-specific restriction endonuclease McrA